MQMPVQFIPAHAFLLILLLKARIESKAAGLVVFYLTRERLKSIFFIDTKKRETL